MRAIGLRPAWMLHIDSETFQYFSSRRHKASQRRYGRKDWILEPQKEMAIGVRTTAAVSAEASRLKNKVHSFWPPEP